MKKSVILIIGIVYLASILIVGLMGIRMKFYNPTVYVSSIEYCPEGTLDESASNNARSVYRNGTQMEVVMKEGSAEDYDVYIRDTFEEDITFELKFTVKPENATNDSLDYAFDTGLLYEKTEITDPETGDVTYQEKGIFIYEKNSDGNGVFTFKKPGNVLITVKAADGSNNTVVVSLNVRESTTKPPENGEVN